MKNEINEIKAQMITLLINNKESDEKKFFTEKGHLKILNQLFFFTELRFLLKFHFTSLLTISKFKMYGTQIKMHHFLYLKIYIYYCIYCLLIVELFYLLSFNCSYFIFKFVV